MQLLRIFIITLILLTLCMPAHALILVISSGHPNSPYDDIGLGIYDQNGLYSGVDLNNPNGPALRNSLPFQESSWADGRPDQDATAITNYIHGTLPDGTSANLKLVIHGTKLNFYILYGAIGEQRNDMGHHIQLTGFIDAGQTRYFEIAYVPFQPPVIKKVATSNDLIADINAASKLELIGNAEFVKELIKEVQKIEKERLHPAENEEHDPATPAQRAIKKYQKLLKEITEKYQRPEGDEFVKLEAYSVLKEDIEYIIGHIQ